MANNEFLSALLSGTAFQIPIYLETKGGKSKVGYLSTTYGPLPRIGEKIRLYNVKRSDEEGEVPLLTVLISDIIWDTDNEVEPIQILTKLWDPIKDVQTDIF